MALSLHVFCSALSVDVCTGGSCVRAGAGLLLDTVDAVSPSVLTARPVGCMSACCQLAVCRVDGATKKLRALSLSEAIDSAYELVEEAGGTVDPNLVEAFIAKADAEAFILAGKAEDAITSFTAALAAQGSIEPVHDPIPAEALEWGGTVWACEDERGAFGTELVCDESITTFEFGQGDDGEACIPPSWMFDHTWLSHWIPHQSRLVSIWILRGS